MAIFKCKMCGGTIEIQQGESVGVCEYCGTKQTLPKLDDERKVNLYDRANHFRRNNDFDKAMGIYEQILNEDGTDAEAYWSLVLCRYGIEYVEDPATKKRIPTVNRAQYTSIFADEDYKSALQYADTYQKSIYEAEAKAIDEIQKGILEISQKEEPFDVFICYKETGNDGRRTPDSVLATELYHELTREGFKVFFSRITLEDKLGTAYEPYIFAALHSAKVMVALGTKAEYFNAVWVKNEWSRFLALIKAGERKTLIPAYKDMDPYDLPEEFSHLQAQDMSKLGFMSDLVRGINKILASGKEPAAKETVVVNNSAGTGVAPLLKRAFMFLEDGDWSSADEYCEKVLDLDPENAEAYLGKLMAELQVNKEAELAECEESFDDNRNYQKVIKFGSEELVQKINEYIAQINKSNEEAEKIFLKTVDNIAESIIFEGNKRNAKNVQEKLSKEKSKLIDLRDLSKSFEVKSNNLNRMSKEKDEYENKKKDLKNKRDSLGLFAGKQKKQIDTEILDLCDSISALNLKIRNLSSSLKGYKSIKDVGSALQKQEELVTKLENELNKIDSSDNLVFPFELARDLFNSDERIQEIISSKYPEVFNVIPKTISFGNYYFDSSENKEPIEWLVLDSQGNKSLLISKYALDLIPYNVKFMDITWENCTLRRWLNTTFLDSAFTYAEQSKILTTKVVAENNLEFGTYAGNDTTDKVFLLSINEANKYFDSYRERECKATPFAEAKSPETSLSWWLRSPGESSHTAADVFKTGCISTTGCTVAADDHIYVRPAMWVKL